MDTDARRSARGVRLHRRIQPDTPRRTQGTSHRLRHLRIAGASRREYRGLPEYQSAHSAVAHANTPPEPQHQGPSAAMNARRLFVASCIALIVTAMSFALRGGATGAWVAEFDLSYE